MKKNRMMRLASILLVLVLMTSSVVGGTFAKYTTSGSATDTARVAAWGVEIKTVSGSDFAKSYQTHDTASGVGAISVKADDKVVAPGTSAADVDGDVKFTITGTPEVAVEVKFEVVANNEIKLSAGDYNDYTTADDDGDTFNLADEYYPVLFTLTKDGTDLVTAGTLSAVAAALNAESDKYPPNTTLDCEYVLTWAWAFDGAQTLNGVAFDADTVDKADTFLGMNPQQLGYELKVSVTQID